MTPSWHALAVTPSLVPGACAKRHVLGSPAHASFLFFLSLISSIPLSEGSLLSSFSRFLLYVCVALSPSFPFLLIRLPSLSSFSRSLSPLFCKWMCVVVCVLDMSLPVISFCKCMCGWDVCVMPSLLLLSLSLDSVCVYIIVGVHQAICVVCCSGTRSEDLRDCLACNSKSACCVPAVCPWECCKFLFSSSSPISFFLRLKALSSPVSLQVWVWLCRDALSRPLSPRDTTADAWSPETSVKRRVLRWECCKCFPSLSSSLCRFLEDLYHRALWSQSAKHYKTVFLNTINLLEMYTCCNLWRSVSPNTKTNLHY